jgi:hypothetical protein
VEIAYSSLLRIPELRRNVTPRSQDFLGQALHTKKTKNPSSLLKERLKRRAKRLGN